MDQSSCEICVFESADAVATSAAQFILDRIRDKKKSHRFSIALSGGSTPKIIYKKFVSMSDAGELLRNRVDYFFSDERAVGPEDNNSNYKTARVRLFDPLNISASVVQRLYGEAADLTKEATRYADIILEKVQLVDSLPAFDITMLGLGPDGHTASLFPDYDFTQDSGQLILAPYVTSQSSYRLSFSLKLINASRQVLFLVTGAAKAEALAEIIMPTGRELLPAARIQAKSIIWMIDKSAASKLDPENIEMVTP